MTEIEISTGASSALTAKTWDSLSWQKIDKHVTRLQMRIGLLATNPPNFRQSVC